VSTGEGQQDCSVGGEERPNDVLTLQPAQGELPMPAEDTPIPGDPRVHFISGDDFVKFFGSGTAEAENWSTGAHGQKPSMLPESPIGEWLRPWYRVSEKEVVWCVNHAVLHFTDRPFQVEVRHIPGRPEPLVLRHPDQGHPLWDHDDPPSTIR